MNFYNYPQCQEYSCISTPYNDSTFYEAFATSGALSLGTSAGVGVDFAQSGVITCSCQLGSWQSTYGFWHGVTEQCGYIISSHGYQGVQSFDLDDTSCAVSAIHNYTGSSNTCHWSMVSSCESSGWVFTENRYSSNASGWPTSYGMSTYCVASNGTLSFVSTASPCSTYHGLSRQLYHDEKSIWLFGMRTCGLGVWCYNGANGQLTQTEYCGGTSGNGTYYREGCGVYALDFHGCCLVLTASCLGVNMSINCLNTSTGDLGVICHDFSPYEMFHGGGTPGRCPMQLCGGGATNCDATDGGFFILNNYLELLIGCLYCSNNTVCICWKNCYVSAPHLCALGISVDDDYVYLLRRGVHPNDSGNVRIATLTFDASTGSLCSTTIANNWKGYSIPSGNYWNYSQIHSTGSCLLYHLVCGGSTMCLTMLRKPVASRSVRDRYGGSAPDAISEYYHGGSYVNDSDIPSSGTIKFSDFYGQ